MFPLAKFRPSTVSGEGRGALLSLLGGDAPPGFLRLLQETLHLGAWALLQETLRMGAWAPVHTYSQHTVNIQSTYSQHTVNIQSTGSFFLLILARGAEWQLILIKKKKN